MNMEKFGDSYDLVKRSLLLCLSDFGEWSVLPMFTDKNPRLYAEDYCHLLGVTAVSTERLTSSSRTHLIEVASKTQDHLFLDPDTGLRLEQPDKNNQKYLLASELATIAEARPERLTLVFDQSIQRIRGAGAKEKQLKTKLKWLKSKKIYGLVYVSHANFILVSRDLVLLKQARCTLINASKLPASRFLDLNPV